MEENSCAYTVAVGSLRESDHLEVAGIDWRIILRWMFRKWHGGGHGLDCSVSGFGPVAGYFYMR